MAATDLQLPAMMRANLLTLQVTQQGMAAAQQRLATGLKVNVALDNPSVYFAAKGLTQRAGDLTAMKDAIGQAISTVKAADKGVGSITSLLQQARGLTSAALASLGTDDASIRTRKALAGQFDTLIDQINGVSGDSGYGGKNLLVGDGSKLDATPESKAAVQDLVGIRRARVTNISEPDDYQIGITGTGRITGAVGDIANAERTLGLTAVKVSGVKSPTSGDFNPISISLSGGPGTDKVVTVENPPDSFTQRFTTAQWKAADTAGTSLNFDHTFTSGAQVRFGVDFDLIDATPQSVGSRTAQIEKQVELAVSVTDSTGFSVTRDAKNTLELGKLIEGENSFVFPSGTVRLIIDPKTIRPQGDNFDERNHFDANGMPISNAVGIAKADDLPLARSGYLHFDVGAADSDAPGFRTFDVFDARYGTTTTVAVPNGDVKDFPITLGGSNSNSGTTVRVTVKDNGGAPGGGIAGIAVDTPAFQFGVQSGSTIPSASLVLDSIEGFLPGVNTKFFWEWGGFDSAGSGMTTFTVRDDSGRVFSHDLPNIYSNTMEVTFPENETYPNSKFDMYIQSNFVFDPNPGGQEAHIIWPGKPSTGASLKTALVTPATHANDMFAAFDAAHRNGVTVESQNLQVEGKGLHVDFSQNSWVDRQDIENAIKGLDAAEQRVRSASQALTTSLGIISTRQDFMRGFSDVLDEGASKLTLADQNEEGSNLLMLQTRQQLSQTALGMASRSQQSILSLFR